MRSFFWKHEYAKAHASLSHTGSLGHHPPNDLPNLGFFADTFKTDTYRIVGSKLPSKSKNHNFSLHLQLKF
jgi:hypothetical protein